MKKLIYTLLLGVLIISNVMAQLPSHWEKLQGEYLVTYKQGTKPVAKPKTTQVLPQRHKTNLSQQEVNALWDNPDVEFISDIYRSGDEEYVALSNELLIITSVSIHELLENTGVYNLVQTIDSICFDTLCVYAVRFLTRDPLGFCKQIAQNPACLSGGQLYPVYTT